MKKLLSLLFALVLLAMVVPAFALDFTLETPKDGYAFSYQNEKNKSVTLASFKGKHLLQIYGNSDPMDGATPALLQVLYGHHQKELKKAGVEVLVILKNATSAYLKQMSSTYPGFHFVTFRDTAQLGKYLLLYGVGAGKTYYYPVLFFHNAKGQVIYHYVSVGAPTSDLITPSDSSQVDKLAEMMIRVATAKGPLSITLNHTSAALNMSSNKKIQLKVKEDLKNEKVTWTSSNKKVATVSSKGKVTAKGYGQATITAETESGAKATCEINVSEPFVYIADYKSGKKGSLIVVLDANTTMDTFEVSYSKSGSTDWKTITLKKTASSAQVTLSGLSSGAMYRIKVRGQYTANGKKYTTDWSDIEYFTAD